MNLNLGEKEELVLKNLLNMIEFSNVNFRYSKKAKFNLEDINFSLKKGEITAIVGLMDLVKVLF